MFATSKNNTFKKSFGTVYLPSAEIVLDLLLRHSENILKHICSKLLYDHRLVTVCASE